MRRMQTLRTHLLHALDLAVADAASRFTGFACWHGCDARVFGLGVGAFVLAGDVVEFGRLDY
jgi:hypothetical protein